MSITDWSSDVCSSDLQVYQGAYHPTAKPATYRRKTCHDAMRRNVVSLERTASMLGNKGRWLAILALVASARVAAADASAASAHGGSDGAVTTLEAMVVVATRTARPAYSTPAAVSIIDAERIAQIQPYGYADVFEGLPGVAIEGGPRRIAEEPSIRGFSDEQVVIRVDGTRQNFHETQRGRFLPPKTEERGGGKKGDR